MIIRAYRSPDEFEVVALWERAGLTRPWNDPRQDILRKVCAGDDWFLVGELDGQVIATAMVGYEGHRGWINYLAVDPGHQRNGFGQAIMEEAERMLKAAGCPKINLQIRADNQEAIAFYQRIGFSEDQVVSFGKRLISDQEDGASP